MPSAPPTGTNIWTLSAADVSGGTDGKKLAGCHIVQNATNYTFTKPDWTVLSTSTGTTLPTGSFTFPSFDYKDITGWSVTMQAPPAVSTQNWGADNWSFPNQPLIEGTGPISGESGEFTAQAGSGLGQGEGDAHSAKAKGGAH
jgi:hypothetical protein